MRPRARVAGGQVALAQGQAHQGHALGGQVQVQQHALEPAGGHRRLAQLVPGEDGQLDLRRVEVLAGRIDLAHQVQQVAEPVRGRCGSSPSSPSGQGRLAGLGQLVGRPPAQHQIAACLGRPAAQHRQQVVRHVRLAPAVVISSRSSRARGDGVLQQRSPAQGGSSARGRTSVDGRRGIARRPAAGWPPADPSAASASGSAARVDQTRQEFVVDAGVDRARPADRCASGPG